MHHLLKQQIKKFLGDPSQVPAELKELLDAVDAAYTEADNDYDLLERAMDLASDELLEKNTKLKQEVADRKKAQEDIQKLIQANQAILNSAGEGIYRADMEGNAIFVNPAAGEILGYNADEIIGKNLHDVIHHSKPDGQPYPIEECPLYIALKNGSDHVEMEDVFWRKDGSPVPVELIAKTMVENGKTVGVVVTFQDITQRKRDEERIKNINVELEKRVEERTADLMLANKCQEQEIKVRLKAEHALIEAKNEAERANRAKSQFLSRMSHELRTPMNAILGFGQLLECDTGDPLSPGQKERVDEILKAGKHLLDLINEVLDLARIESGREDLKIEDVNVQKVAEEALKLIQPEAADRGIKVENTIPEDLDVCVQADATRLKQVLINLLSNAVKYNRRHGKVTLSMETPSHEKLGIHVVDTGKGIAPEKIENLFEPFDRLDADEFDSSGTGIGLTITRQLLELMDGTITVQSTVGKGSCFTVEIPLVQAGNACGKIVEAVCNMPEGPCDEAPNEMEKKTLLYIEDNPVNVTVVEQMLAKFTGVELMSAPNAQIGLELAGERLPDLILMDIDLPGMDGITATEKLKTQGATKHIPVVAVSAKAFDLDIEKALSKGFHSYITKPIDMPHFIQALKEILDLGPASPVQK